MIEYMLTKAVTFVAKSGGECGEMRMSQGYLRALSCMSCSVCQMKKCTIRANMAFTH